MKKIFYGLLLISSFIFASLTFSEMNKFPHELSQIDFHEEYPVSTSVFVENNAEFFDSIQPMLASLDDLDVYVRAQTTRTKVENNRQFLYGVNYIYENEAYETIKYEDVEDVIDFTKDTDTFYSSDLQSNEDNQVYLRTPYNRKLLDSYYDNIRPNVSIISEYRSFYTLGEHDINEQAFQIDFYTENKADLQQVKDALSELFEPFQFSENRRNVYFTNPQMRVISMISRPAIMLAILLLAFYIQQFFQLRPIIRVKLLHGYTTRRVTFESFGKMIGACLLITLASFVLSLHLRMDMPFMPSKQVMIYTLSLGLILFVTSIIFVICAMLLIHARARELEGHRNAFDTTPLASLVYLLICFLLLPTLATDAHYYTNLRILDFSQRSNELALYKEDDLYTIANPNLSRINPRMPMSLTALDEIKNLIEEEGIYYSVDYNSIDFTDPNPYLKIKVNMNYVNRYFPEFSQEAKVGDWITSSKVANPNAQFSSDNTVLGLNLEYRVVVEKYDLEIINVNDIFIDRTITSQESLLNYPNVFIDSSKEELFRTRLDEIQEEFKKEGSVIVPLASIKANLNEVFDFMQMYRHLFHFSIVVTIAILYYFILHSYISYREQRFAIHRVHGYSVIEDYEPLVLLTLGLNLIVGFFLLSEGHNHLSLPLFDRPYLYTNGDILFNLAVISIVELVISLVVIRKNEQAILSILKGKSTKELTL